MTPNEALRQYRIDTTLGNLSREDAYEQLLANLGYTLVERAEIVRLRGENV